MWWDFHGTLQVWIKAPPLRRAVPDLTLTIDEMESTDDTLRARMTARGTNQGSVFGFASTGHSVAITVIDVCRFDGAKIVEHWGVPDRSRCWTSSGCFPAAVIRVRRQGG